MIMSSKLPRILARTMPSRDISLAVQTGGESGAEGLAVHRHGDDEDDKVAHYLQNNVDDAIPDDVDNAS
jgi:hypothetical protein